ncbi:MAG: hypothetical protein A9183_06960 [Dehalococcoides mccartyi]|uniref:Reductive dehalogenase n=1 Tax=Dehalococcoides mccartyi TaxID=61435 RepID=A0A2J1E078_9CHLR|nr:reductive dehalogenase [Dehalococcoides mccartyi]OBW62568.1 MAG: hypothetical protein A9183_06960 [Dehalococcoides mccartyi]PKH47860.1 reductive dehalogenase [Dehalococcoides mccartyi]
MSKFHSVVTRRDFMKGLGLAGMGLGAASATAPIFHDLDELVASADSQFKREWWVKEREYLDPTVEVDWDILDFGKPFCPPIGQYMNPNTPQIMERRIKRKKEGMLAQVPGDRLQDMALQETYEKLMHAYMGWPPKFDQTTTFNFGFPTQGIGVNTPAYYGVPRWEGTPEENLKLIRAAMHFFGSSQAFVTEVNSRTRRLFSPVSPLRWEDTPMPYQDNGVNVIPNKVGWEISCTIKQNNVTAASMTKVAESGPTKGYTPHFQAATCYAGYCDHYPLAYKLQFFLVALGYIGIPEWGAPNDLVSTLAVPWGVLGGTGELCRETIICSPEYGTNIRRPVTMFTDLPLAPTKPIDSGIMEFCRTCMICADGCPSQALSREKDPTWDIFMAPDGTPVNRPGLRAYRCDIVAASEYGCPFDCDRCQGVCPFNHDKTASIHSMIRATAGNTTMFNSFFANMEKYTYPAKDWDMDAWWNRDLNNWSGDVLVGFQQKGW